MGEIFYIKKEEIRYAYNFFLQLLKQINIIVDERVTLKLISV
jgi:hypothetical protein